jgi:hypothetical protein
MRKSAFTTVLLAGISAAILISGQTASADPDLVSHWKFDEGSGNIAYDSAGSNNGTKNGATWFNDPCRGMCLSFDGSNDYVTVGDKDNLELQNFTLSFWARLNNPSGSNQGGIAKGYIFGTGAWYSYTLEFSAGNAKAAVSNKSDEEISLTCPIVDNNWHMWTMTAGSNILKFYKDGSLVNSIGYGLIDYTKNNNNFMIGARDSGLYAFNGKMDDVRFYYKVLPSEEINQLYREGLGNIASASNPANGATGVAPSVILSWSPGRYAALHDIYLGNNYNDVNEADTNSPEYKGRRDVNSFDPCGLGFLTTYYWRVDEINGPTLWKGNIWNFTIYSNDPNLVSLWKFDEGIGGLAYDSAGDNDGIITGATWASGQINDALDFDGDGDYVNAQNDSSLNVDAFTISAWVYREQKSGESQHIIDKCQGGNSDGGYVLRAGDNGRITVYLSNGDGSKLSPTFTASNSIPEKTWVHIVATSNGGVINSGDIKIYYDAVEQSGSESNYGLSLGSNTKNLLIGTYRATPGTMNKWNGKIDDVRIYNRVLSTEEVERLYGEGFGGKAHDPYPADGASGVSSNTILSWWPGYLAASHDVYLGTNYNDVNNANMLSPEYKGNFDVNFFDPCDLELTAACYWRIDEVNEPNVWKGDVWSFEIKPVIELSTSQFEFTAFEGGTNPDIQILGVSNGGGGTLNWQTYEGCGWLSVEPNNGSSTGEIDDVNLSVNISGLTIGSYNCNLTVSDGNAVNNPQITSVHLSILPYIEGAL